MKKILTLVLALCMVLSLGTAAFAAGATWADYQAYLIEKAGANAPDLAEFEAQVMAIKSWEELDQTVSPWDQMFTTIGLSTWEEFQAGVVKESAVAGTASGEAAGEASGEASAETKTAEEAYVDYVYEWLLAELAVNSSMTIEQVEDEFMPLIEAGDYVTFPADMLYNGMLNSGVAMTFEEFAAQYVPEGEASGEPSGEAGGTYADYIYEWLLAELAVNSSMTIEQVEDEFMPLIEAGDYVTFPADMLYNGMLNSGVAMTFEEWSAQQ